jgi:RNA polymerase sigma-54 factor
MQLNLGQQMKMSQQMKLAPRMIQSMEILQLPLMALQERIDRELVENVALEIDTKDEAVSDTEREVESEKARDEANGDELDTRELNGDANDKDNMEDFERLLELSDRLGAENLFDGPRTSSGAADDAGDRAHDQMANAISRPQSLHDYLIEQFSFFDVPAELREFAEYLIRNLDHHGRLQSSLAEIAQVYGAGISQERALETLRLIQKLDPPGVGARDVRECLLLQIDPETESGGILTKLVSEHLEDIAANRLPVIQKRTGYSLETIKRAIEDLQTLDPYPGRGFEHVPVQAVRPDITLTKDDADRWVVTMEDEYTPRLRISPKYSKMMRANPDAATKEYIKRKVDSAKWLIESIEQRQNTLKRVAQAIVDHQSDFLDYGPDHIVPLKMEQIAEIVKVHVTTISRAVDDKWIQTPRGLYPLKRFFVGGTTTAEGEEIAWDRIRIKLGEIVEAEDKSRPLSDEALVNELAKHGYDLARRTVTKYRKAMDIPSSRQRREY